MQHPSHCSKIGALTLFRFGKMAAGHRSGQADTPAIQLHIYDLVHAAT